MAKLGSRGKGGGKVSRRSLDPSKGANCTQLVSAHALIGEMAAELVSKVRYCGGELYAAKCLSMLELTVKRLTFALYIGGTHFFEGTHGGDLKRGADWNVERDGEGRNVKRGGNG